MAQELQDFTFDFSEEKFGPYILEGELAAGIASFAESWGNFGADDDDDDSSGDEGIPKEQDSSCQLLDGYVQSILNKAEPVVLAFKSDPRLYDFINEKLERDEKITKAGMMIDSIPRDTGGKPFINFLIGHEIDEEEMVLACYPLVRVSETGREKFELTRVWPKRLFHLIRDKTKDETKTVYRGAWAIMDEDWDNSEKVIKHFKHDNKDLEPLPLTKNSSDEVKCVGVMQVQDAKLPMGKEMSAKDAFVTLLYTCKMNAMTNLQKKGQGKNMIEALGNSQRKMEDIYTACTTMLELYMMRKEKDFIGMSRPSEEIIGSGMGYTGLMYSSRFNIILLICQHLSVVLAILRDLFNHNLDDMESEKYKVMPWNSKSQPSIYTKITDYADKVVDPSVLDSCGLLGIKDYIRTRLVVGNDQDGRACCEEFIEAMNDKMSPGGRMADVVYKDKSFRFKPDGQAIYVTGYLVVPYSFVWKEVRKILKKQEKQEKQEANEENQNGGDSDEDRASDSDADSDDSSDSDNFRKDASQYALQGMKWSFYVCKTGEDKDEEDGEWAMPFEIQVVNKAALEFIDAQHHSYEIQRVAQRISAVCPCTKDAKGDPVPQTQCGHCMYRRSHNLGYCPFCHICFKSGTQEMHCTLACCAGKNDKKKSAEEEINAMDEDALKKKVLALEAELKAWRQNVAVGSGASAVANLKK